jgi:hypothetical protein
MTDEVKDGEEVSEEYRAEFEKLANGEEPSKPEPKDEGKPEPKEEELEEAKPEEKKEDPPAPKDESLPKGEGEPKTGEPEQGAESEPKGDDTGIAKALKDTKAWATKLAQEKKELEKQLEALRGGGGTKQEVEDAKANLGETRKALDEKIKKASEDYPELKEVLDLMAKTSSEALSKAENFDRFKAEEAQRAEARAHFENEVEPEIKKVHPDFRQVAFSKDYMDWLEKQSPAMQYAGMNSLDARDISMTNHRNLRNSKPALMLRKPRLDARNRLEYVRISVLWRGGGSGSGKSKATKFEDLDPNDREAAFRFLAEQDAKKA